jgi:hydrogenase nickel incorporation protein HypA/HybF
MHEFGIAQSILDSVIKKAKEYNAREISRIELRVGLLKMVTPISLQNAFDMVSSGTIANQAKLDVEEVPGDELSIMNIEIEK